MRAAVNRFIAWCAAFAVLAAFPASAAEGDSSGENLWVPSLAVVGGVTLQEQEASVESFDGMGIEVRPSDSDTDLAVSPYVGANLQLMTPAIPLPGRPRVFVNGEILPTFASTRNIAKEGNPTGFSPPNTDIFPEGAITGVGSRTTAEVQTLVYGAGIGIAFPFELRGRQLRVKPSVGWLHYTVDVDGLVLRGIKPGTLGPFFREVALRADDSQSFDGIGPGLEIELDAGRFGPIGSALFLDAHAYKVLGDRSIRLSNSVTISDALDPVLGIETYSAIWSFEVDPWIYRAGLGLRFHWLGSAR